MWAKLHDEYNIVHLQNVQSKSYTDVRKLKKQLPSNLLSAYTVIGSIYVQSSDGEIYEKLEDACT